MYAPAAGVPPVHPAENVSTVPVCDVIVAYDPPIRTIAPTSPPVSNDAPESVMVVASTAVAVPVCLTPMRT